MQNTQLADSDRLLRAFVLDRRWRRRGGGQPTSPVLPMRWSMKIEGRLLDRDVRFSIEFATHTHTPQPATLQGEKTKMVPGMWRESGEVGVEERGGERSSFLYRVCLFVAPWRSPEFQEPSAPAALPSSNLLRPTSLCCCQCARCSHAACLRPFTQIMMLTRSMPAPLADPCPRSERQQPALHTALARCQAGGRPVGPDVIRKRPLHRGTSRGRTVLLALLLLASRAFDAGGNLQCAGSRQLL